MRTMCRLCHGETPTVMHKKSDGKRVPVCVKCGACKCDDCVSLAKAEAAARAAREKLQP